MCCYVFDEISNEEVAWYEEVEEKAVDDVLSAVVVTSDADQDAVLESLVD